MNVFVNKPHIMRKWNEMTKKKFLKNVMKDAAERREMKTEGQAGKKWERKAMNVITSDEEKKIYVHKGGGEENDGR